MARTHYEITPIHKLIIMVGKETRTTEKRKMLARYKGSVVLRRIFDYSLNPFKKFYIKKIPSDVQGKGTCIIDDDTWKLLDRLSSRTLTGAKAKEELFFHMSTLLPSEAHLLRKIVRKKLRIGVSTQIANTIWPGMILVKRVQKAEDWDPAKVTYPCYGSVKLDGIRAEFKNNLFTTRSGFTIDGLDHVRDYLNSIRAGAYYDGELVVWGTDFDTGSGIIRGSADKSMVHYAIFDSPGLHRLPQRLRLDSLKGILPYTVMRPTEHPASALTHRILNNQAEVMQFYNDCLQAGFEGIMVKDMTATYKMGRNYNWMKLKKNFEGEYTILDVYEGEDGFTGMLGGVIIETMHGRTTRVGDGFSHELRRAVWADPSILLGKSGTFTAMEKTKNGKLRHPVFKSERWDI